jgi:hypothetical protein
MLRQFNTGQEAYAHHGKGHELADQWRGRQYYIFTLCVSIHRQVFHPVRDFLRGQGNSYRAAGKPHEELSVVVLHQLIQHVHLFRLEAVLGKHVLRGFGGHSAMQNS